MTHEGAGKKREVRSSLSTGRGDDGTTGLLYGGGRVPKDDLRVEAYGSIDEAVAALGLARAELTSADRYGGLPRTLAGLPDLILRFQRELFVVAADLATAPGALEKQIPGQSRVTQEMVSGLDELLTQTEPHVDVPKEFVVPGESRLSAALEVARTAVRRAERRAVTLRRAEPLAEPRPLALADDFVIPYLNRLGDLLWLLARAAENGEGRSPVPSRPERSRRIPDSAKLA